MRKKIYFLILNYKTKNETVNCISSINDLYEVEYGKEIIVIDNCSEDGSYESLRELYKNNDSVSIYKMDSNVGFSKANNYGYQIIKEKNDAKLIIICNSDIEFRQKKFLRILCSEYERLNFDLCGPDVYCCSDLKKGWRGHQSPAYPWESKRWFVKIQIKYNTVKLKWLKSKKNIMQNVIIVVFMKFLNVFLFVLMNTVYKDYKMEIHRDIPLHGSCIVVSEKFILNEEKVFNPETKFYGEELLLFLNQRRKRYNTFYLPCLKVWHMQGKSTSKINNVIERKIFICENLKRSAEIYLEESNIKL